MNSVAVRLAKCSGLKASTSFRLLIPASTASKESQNSSWMSTSREDGPGWGCGAGSGAIWGAAAMDDPPFLGGHCTHPQSSLFLQEKSGALGFMPPLASWTDCPRHHSRISDIALEAP